MAAGKNKGKKERTKENKRNINIISYAGHGNFGIVM
jgi:hypothetical protein